MSENKNNFPKRLDELLKKHGMTYAALSRELNINRSTMSMWKSGKITPKAETILKIADYFNVSPDYLMGIEGQFAPNKEPKKVQFFVSSTYQDAKYSKDINEILFNTEELLKQDGLMFDGNPASPEAIESILSAMQIGMEMAKKKNKEKYTPQKYRKDTE